MDARTNSDRARLSLLEGKVKGLLGATQPRVFGVADIPQWTAVRQTSGTFTPGTDWESEFEDGSASDRVVHSIQTQGGELSHVNSDNAAVRTTIRFSSQGKGSIKLFLGISGSGRVQVKANGLSSEYTASQAIDVPTVRHPMRNELVVMSDGTGGAFQFSLDGLLFDGENRKWIS